MAYTGIYERTIFYNPVNKYSVISVKTSDRSIPEKARSAYRHRDNMIHFAAVGYELPRTDQVSMILDGEWKEGKNGVQLHVTQCEEVVPQTREGIKGYLSSRLIKGIGGKTAELIVDRFGADTLHVLENEPERLLEIRGVSKAKLEEIIASYNERRGNSPPTAPSGSMPMRSGTSSRKGKPGRSAATERAPDRMQRPAFGRGYNKGLSLSETAPFWCFRSFLAVIAKECAPPSR